MPNLKEIALRALELTDRNDLAGREALMTPDAEFITPGGALSGPAEASAYSRPFLAAFPDSHHDCRLVIQDGHRVVVEGTWTGHHTGVLATPAGDIPATGRPVELPFVVVFTFDGDRARTVSIYFDQLTFMAQLGLSPVPQAA